MEQDPIENDAVPMPDTPSGFEVFNTYVGSYKLARLGDAAVDAQLAPAPEIQPGITSPLPTVNEVDMWLTEWWAVTLQLDTYSAATRGQDAADWTHLCGTIVRIDHISIRYVPSAEPPHPALVHERCGAVVHTVSSLWPMQRHRSICGWIVRIRRL